MNVQKNSTVILTLTPIFIIVGQLLNIITPSVAGVIRPDFSLVFLFLCVMIHPTIKQVFLASSITIIVSMFFGGNPIFQIPSVFDRVTSALLCLMLYKLVINTGQKLFLSKIGAIYLISTIVSGCIYVLSVYFLGKAFGIAELLTVFKMGLPLLFVTIIATAVVNYFLGILVYKTLSLVSHNKYLTSVNSNKSVS